MGKRRLAIFLVMLLLQLALPTFAAEADGSIQLALPGGNLMLFQVAVFSEPGTLQLTADFDDWEGTLDHLSSPETAKALALFAQKNRCSATEKTVTNGSILFSGLEPGLYLLLQTEAASGYEPITPFLITMPIGGAEGNTNKIDATPKIQPVAKPTQPVPALPQTGQNKLPVPLLGISGLILFLIGLALQRRSHG